MNKNTALSPEEIDELKKSKALKYVKAQSAPLQKIFKSQPHLRAFITWTPQWSTPKKKYLKRPDQLTNKPSTHKTLQSVLNSPKHTVGLVHDDSHPYISLDIDGVDLSASNNPALKPIKNLLESHPTYQEKSPSGKPNRLRVIYKLATTAQKKELMPHPTCRPEGQDCDIELFNSSKNFVTLTGRHISTSPLSIATIDVGHILEAFPSFAPKLPSNVTPLETATQPKPAYLANLVPVQTWLQEVPLDRNDPKVIRLMSQKGYVYYDYWLLGVTALFATFGPADGFHHADVWSRKSGKDEYDQDELAEKWQTLSEDKLNGVTHATYQWMFNQFTIPWPVTRGKTAVPDPLEISNFQAYLKHHELTLGVDALTHTPYLNGPEYALYPQYYHDQESSWTITNDMSRLASILHNQMRDYNFRPSHNQCKLFIKAEICKLLPVDYTNRFAEYVATLPLYDPKLEPDYIKQISQEVLQHDPVHPHPTPEFHDTLVHKWLLSLARTFWPGELNNPAHKYATSEGLLILSGQKGGIGKSSFGRRLFPPEWRHLYTAVTPRFSGMSEDKDYKQKTVTSIVVDYDEFERITSSNKDADIKSAITADYDTFRAPYADAPQTYLRRYAAMASTNQRDVQIPQEGARRYWWLNVRYVDTYLMDDLDMYNLWRQLRYELRSYSGKRAPWLLKPSDIRYLEQYLSPHRTETSLDIDLMEAFDPSNFTEYLEELKKNPPEGKTGYSSPNFLITYSIGEIRDIINHTGTMAALKRALIRFTKEHAPQDFKLTNRAAAILQGMVTIRGQLRFLMPPRRQDELIREAANDPL